MTLEVVETRDASLEVLYCLRHLQQSLEFVFARFEESLLVVFTFDDDLLVILLRRESNWNQELGLLLSCSSVILYPRARRHHLHEVCISVASPSRLVKALATTFLISSISY